jgi:predicted nucleic acid-binding protein
MIDYDELTYREATLDIENKINRIESAIEVAWAEVRKARRDLSKHNINSVAIRLRDLDEAASVSATIAVFLADALYESKLIAID